jgi:hypothetical protein
MTQEIITAIDAGRAEKELAERLWTQDSSAADRASALIAYLVAGNGVDISGKIISAVWDDWGNLHKTALSPDIYTLRRTAPQP